MSFSSKLKPITGFVIIISIIIAYGLIVDEMKKIPLNYEMISEQEGQDRVLKLKDGKLSEPFWIRETLRQDVASVDGNILKIKSTVTGMDSATNQIVFNNTQTFFVDRESRKHSQGDEYFTFPPNVQKHDYEFFHPMIFTKTTFNFQQARSIDGLEVYDFSCKYEGTDVSSAFPQFPDDKILSDGRCTASVEPVTGIIVSFSKEWDDYFVVRGARGEQVELGGKYTTEYSKAILTEQAKSTKSLYYFLDVITPSLIAVIGVVALFVILLFQKTKNQAKMIIQTQNELIKKVKLSSIGEITSRISHDLRNPINVIKLSAEAIEMRVAKELDPKLDEYIPVIKDAILRMTHQINQILGFVKTTPLEVKLISVSNTLKETIKIISIPKNVSVVLPEEDFSLMADKIQLSVAFGNILLNAVEAIGEKQGRVTIRANSKNGNLIIEFEDSGIGIRKEDIGKIFDPLFTTKQGGTGLGLSSVRQVVEAHGGTISVRSPPTVFTITLPQNQHQLESK